MTTSGPIRPHQGKSLPNIAGVRIVNGKITLIPVVTSKRYKITMWLAYLQKNTNIYDIQHELSPNDAHAFNTAWTTLHMLQERIHVLQKAFTTYSYVPTP
jgi:hypothetical protein